MTENEIGITYKSKTYGKWTPCGNIYITIAYRIDEPKRVDFIRIVGSNKTNECGASWFESKADDLSFMIRRIRNIHEAKAIIKNQCYHRCNKYIPNRDKVQSCSDAIGRVLEKELIEKEEKETETKTLV